MDSDSKRVQVAAQCRVVAALCKNLGAVAQDYAMLIDTGAMDELLDMVGARSAEHMEIFGDILNGMDAVSPDDDWMTPVFEQAHRLWPTTRERH